LTDEAKALSDILRPVTDTEATDSEVIYMINDNRNDLGSTPKERILNALKSLP